METNDLEKALVMKDSNPNACNANSRGLKCESKITVSIETITPEIAKEMLSISETSFLESVEQQRHTRNNTVNAYSEKMSKGEWRLNGETIKFTEDGKCIDGLHRLNACVDSNTPFETIVVRNIPLETITTIDMNARRSTQDLLVMLAKSYENGAAEIVKQKLTLDRHCKHRGASTTNSKLCEQDKVDEYEKYSSLYNESVIFSKNIYNDSNKAIMKSEAGAVYMHLIYTLGWDKDIVSDWLRKLAMCKPKDSNGNIFERTLSKLQNKKLYRGSDRTNLFISCWNSYVKNRKNLQKEEWFISSIEYQNTKEFN